jgi:hypothetical protein
MVMVFWCILASLGTVGECMVETWIPRTKRGNFNAKSRPSFILMIEKCLAFARYDHQNIKPHIKCSLVSFLKTGQDEKCCGFCTGTP